MDVPEGPNVGLVGKIQPENLRGGRVIAALPYQMLKSVGERECILTVVGGVGVRAKLLGYSKL